MTNDNKPKNNDISSWLDTLTAKVAIAVTAVTLTFVTLRTEVSRAFFKSMNKGDNGAFLDLQLKRDNAINAITAPIKRGIEVPNALDKVHKINSEYDMNYLKRRKLLGIRGLFNPLSIFDEAKALKKHQWLEVAFATAAVASIAVGAILTMASSRGAEKRLNEMEDEKKTVMMR